MRTYLYHQNTPKGEIFDTEEVDIETLLEDGWLDSPATLDIPEELPEMTVEKVKRLAPDELISLVKGLGFLVMSQMEFDAEINKALLPTIPETSGAETITSNDNLLDIFNESPTDLNKEDLIILGNNVYKLSLRMTMKEETLINHIKAAQEAQ